MIAFFLLVIFLGILFYVRVDKRTGVYSTSRKKLHVKILDFRQCGTGEDLKVVTLVSITLILLRVLAKRFSDTLSFYYHVYYLLRVLHFAKTYGPGERTLFMADEVD